MSARAAGTGEGAPAVITRKTWVYHVGLLFCWLLVRVWLRARIRGRERLPRGGGYLVIANHQSFADIPLIGVGLRRHAAFVAREDLTRSRFMAWFMPRTGAILVKRGAADRAALREMVAHLEAGDPVVVFPEGTRSRDGSLGEFKGGVLFAARRAGCPIVPAGIRGAFEAWPRTARLPRPRRVSLEFGEPLDPAAAGAPEELRERVAALVGDGRFAR